MTKKLRNVEGSRRPATDQSLSGKSLGPADTVRLVMSPTITSGRDAWYAADDNTTAGRRLMPVTPGKSMTTTSPALNKVFILGINPDGVLE